MHDEVLAEVLEIPSSAELLLTIEEAAQRLRIGRTTMCALIADGHVRSITIGRRRFVPVECLHDYIAAKLAEARHEEAA